MLKTLPLKIAKKNELQPKTETIFALLNYSKSTNVIVVRNRKKILNFN
jgi:hypothetical protein